MAAQDGWYEPQHCISCDGTGRRYYPPNDEFKKTCLSCKGTGFKEVWIDREQRAWEEKRKEENRERNRILAAERAEADKILAAERAKAIARSNMIFYAILLAVIGGVVTFIAAYPMILTYALFIGIILLIAWFLSMG